MKKYRLLLKPLLVMLLALQLTSCGDLETTQREEFISFLQNTVLRGGEQVPALSDAQRKKFGEYANDYTLLFDFSREMQQAVNSGLIPLLNVLSDVKTAEDYSKKNDQVRRALATFEILEQQLQTNHARVDNMYRSLQLRSDLKPVYERAYDKIVTKPADRLLPLLPQLSGLAKDVVQLGDFLKVQEGQVTFNEGGVQFASAELVEKYNYLIDSIKGKQQILQNIDRASLE